MNMTQNNSQSHRIAQDDISKIENGCYHENPSLKTIEKNCKRYGVKIKT